MPGEECGHGQGAGKDRSPGKKTSDRGDDAGRPTMEVLAVEDSVEQIELREEGVDADPCLTVKDDVGDPAEDTDRREQGDALHNAMAKPEAAHHEDDTGFGKQGEDDQNRRTGDVEDCGKDVEDSGQREYRALQKAASGAKTDTVRGEHEGGAAEQQGAEAERGDERDTKVGAGVDEHDGEMREDAKPSDDPIAQPSAGAGAVD